MKRRFLSLLTAFALCLTLIPTTAFADDEESGEDVPPCICETACTEEVMNPDCPVCGAEDAREAAYTGVGFEDEMLVMANFPAGMMNTFLGLFRRMGIAPVALKAMLTPTNAAWDSEKLHEELAGEHRAMTSGEGKRHQG